MDKTNINANVDTDLQEQGNGENTAENTDVRTFTQEQVDNIVEKRLAKERRRLMGMISDDENIKAELTKSKLELEVTKKLNDSKYPSCLSGLMDYTSAEACVESYEKITKVFDEAIKQAIEEKFKAAGRNPNAGRGWADNPGAYRAYESTNELRSAFGLNKDN